MERSYSTSKRLGELVRMAVPLCKKAQQQCKRRGQGRSRTYADWMFAVLIMVAVLKGRKSKSAQFRFLSQHKSELRSLLAFTKFPSRSTYFRRYRSAARIFEAAIIVQGEAAIQEGIADPTIVAVDKSVLEALGPAWSNKAKAEGRVPVGVDRQASWTFSKHDSWTYGYAYEVLVSAGKKGVVFPLVASADTAKVREVTTFPAKIAVLPRQTKFVTADKGYDSNQIGEAIEWTSEGRRTSRRYLCPQIYRRGEHRRACRPRKEKGARRLHRQRRQERDSYFQRPCAKKLYARRGQTVEPFNQWFKSLFDLHPTVWHRGLENNQTQLLAAIFGYQLLVRYNHRKGNTTAEIQWIIDGL